MQFSILSVFVAGLAATVAAQSSQSTSTQPTSTQSANCEITHFVQPPVNPSCTFYDNTSTTTDYTVCGGCTIVTRHLGVGLPCRTETTVSGVATVTALACKRGENGRL